MVKDKIITIISPNTLVCLGLKSVLSEYFTANNINITNSYDDFIAGNTDITPDLIFMPPDIYVLHEYFQGIKSRIIVMLEKNEKLLTNQSSLTFLDISLSPSEIIDNLYAIFNSKIRTKKNDHHEGLSVRETEVLKLVAIGQMNKQIADKLNISLHTVISHRKNLTRKLGINTVSGLTVYALLNGLITSDDLNNVHTTNRQDM